MTIVVDVLVVVDFLARAQKSLPDARSSILTRTIEILAHLVFDLAFMAVSSRLKAPFRNDIRTYYPILLIFN